jgi:hypothetical protein
MRSPTVTTIRFHPTIVPRANAIATATFTGVGMNLAGAIQLVAS